MINTLLKMTENFQFAKIWLIVPRKEIIPALYFSDVCLHSGPRQNLVAAVVSGLGFLNECRWAQSIFVNL